MSGVEALGRRRRRVRRGWREIACLCLCLLGAEVVGALAPERAHAQSEDQIKAAFLFNFARYVDFPSEAFARPAAPIVICLYDAEAFASVVSQAVSGKSVGNRPVEVERLDDLSRAKRCHLLYIGPDDPSRPGRVVSQLAGARVFTVSDLEGFAAAGGMANFFRADNKIRFEMNPSAAKRAGLKISSRLLRLAEVVE